MWQYTGGVNRSGIVSALRRVAAEITRGRPDCLQVQDGGGWIDATPIPGAFVVNIGELLELASDGYLHATVPLLALPPDLAAQARGPESDPENPLLREVGRNILKGRLRSHPDVAQRHYPDLLDAGGPAEPLPADPTSTNGAPTR